MIQLIAFENEVIKVTEPSLLIAWTTFYQFTLVVFFAGFLSALLIDDLFKFRSQNGITYMLVNKFLTLKVKE